uniref:Single-stranded DNA-binding protein n=2 Tax=Rhizophora mucronata TaxID=61149 RepID=A0A2P2JHZ7_RHIMU
MANLMAALSRRLSRSLLSNPKMAHISMPFCTGNVASTENSASDEPTSDSDINSILDPNPLSLPTEKEPLVQRRQLADRPLENGLDNGIYKAILVGWVGKNPIQRTFKNGKVVTLLSVSTGGIRDYRKPLENEDPKEDANRPSVQWHRVVVYPQRLGNLIMKNAVSGSIVYLEGNLETKVWGNPVTGHAQRTREIAIRPNGRIWFLSNGGSGWPASPSELK